MKRGKRLTREQKACLMAHKLNPQMWMLVEETEFFYRIIHKQKKTFKMVDKFAK